MLQLQDDLPRLYNLIRIARTEHDQVGHSPQRRQLLDRLVGWSILSYSNGVVCENEDRRTLHQGRQPDTGPHVVTEVKECRAECANPRHSHAIHTRAHHVLAYPEV